MHSVFRKKITLFSVLIFSILLANGQEETGYEIKVTFKPFKNKHIYLSLKIPFTLGQLARVYGICLVSFAM